MRGLTEVLDEGRWQVWRVEDPAPLADGADVLELGHDRIVLRAQDTGRIFLRVRFTPYWAIVDGEGCVGRSPGAGEWTIVRARRPGRIVLATRFAPGRIRATGQRCTD